MMRVLELVEGTGGLGWVVVKAVLMFAVAVMGLRPGAGGRAPGPPPMRCSSDDSLAAA
jgi:hypothetical protein